MKDYNKLSLIAHEKTKGKFAMHSKMEVKNRDDLSIAYSPGVAAPCLEIAKDKQLAYKYTCKQNTIAVVSDGTAVLGLGDIGPEAALPVMEGKAILFKQFGDVDAVPLCIDTTDTEEIIKFCKLIAPTFGGINLEDIGSPKCVTIERRLKEELDIPVFHDDQHGTAIVTTAAVINACRLTGRKVEDLNVLMSGTGAAGSSIARMLKKLGVKNIYANNSKGLVMDNKHSKYRFVVQELLDDGIITSYEGKDDFAEAFTNMDVFVGVSAAGIVKPEMIQKMNKNPWVFAMANPIPEIMPDIATKAGAYIVGTGRSDFPNQINNVSAFPGIFRGALDAHSSKITEGMKLAAAEAIAYALKDNEIKTDFIIPDSLDLDVAKEVAKRVAAKAIEEGHGRNK